MSQPNDNLPPPGRMIGGMALIVVGLLILIPSGLCTAVMGGMSLFEMFSSSTGLNILPEVLTFGLPFIAIGIALFYAGRRMRRRQ